VNGVLVNLARILRLKGGPQNLPASWVLTIFLLSVYIVQNLITGQQLDDDNAAAKSLLSVCLQIGVLTGLLYWRNTLERFAQTMSALAAAGVFFNIVTWILLSFSDPTANQPILASVWFAVFIWSLFVDAHIYRHSLSVHFSTGMLVTVLLLAASYVLIEIWFIFGVT
jgi:hypothetical protein